MRGLALTRGGVPGDIILEKGDIKLTSGDDLLCQTVERVIGTNLGEWWLNEEEGVPFSVFRGKNINYDRLQDEIAAALRYVDETFVMNSFSAQAEGRRLTVRFTAANADGEVAASYGFTI